MSVIRPFAGLHYNTTQQSDVSRLLAPPYDVLDQADKDRLLGQDPHNFVKIDLPFIPPKKAGPPEVYTAAQQQLAAWLADGTFVRDAKPAIYVYHQTYTHAGTTYVRKMFFARLRLEPFGEGSLFPHEQTFGGPKEDRLALTKATQTNLSPIFGLYEDAANTVAKTLEAALSAAPLALGTLDGVQNQMWAVTDPAVIAQVTQLMQSKPIYIADGHHRTGTAMLYRDWLTAQHGTLPAEHPANYVLCTFCAMEDPGLLILPTHRVLPDVKLAADFFAKDSHVTVAPLTAKNATDAVHALAEYGPQAVAWYAGDTQTYYVVRPTNPDLLDAYESKHAPAWRRLGLAFLHAYLLDRVITPQVAGGTAPTIQYIKADNAAVQAANQSRGTAFLMQPTTMTELRDVCTANDLMPQKSTYFYPKLASGLIVNPLTA